MGTAKAGEEEGDGAPLPASPALVVVAVVDDKGNGGAYMPARTSLAEARVRLKCEERT